MGTSGAEIGAAFGGNKVRAPYLYLILSAHCANFSEHWMVIIYRSMSHSSTNHSFRGRESGGDAWKQYVRWSACTGMLIAASALPLHSRLVTVHSQLFEPSAVGSRCQLLHVD